MSSPVHKQDRDETTVMESQNNTNTAHERLIKSREKTQLDKAVLETYNLTVDNTNGYQLKFDDMNWSINMNGLKPLVRNL